MMDSTLRLAAQRVGYHPSTILSLAQEAAWSSTRLLAELDRTDLIARLWSGVVEVQADRVAATIGPSGMRDLTDARALALIAPSLRTAVSKHDANSVVLLGPTGVGKSIAAMLMARNFARNHVRAVLGPNPDLSMEFRWRPIWNPVAWAEAVVLAQAAARHPLGEGAAPELDAAKRARLLVLDDVAWAGRDETFLEVLGHRYDASLPTIFTVGLSRAELLRRYGDAVVRRMVEVQGRKGLLVEVTSP